MIKNNLKVAFRHLLHQRGYTLLNVLGLTLGITFSLLIILYVFHEMSYDRFQSRADRIFRISSDLKEPDNAFRWASTQSSLGPALKEQFGEVEQFCRMAERGRTRLEYNQVNYFERRVFYADSTVFEVFDYELLSGGQDALDAPNSIVLNKTIADKIFKGEDPLGKLLKWDDGASLQVTGVFEDMPQNAHMVTNALISYANNPNQFGWGGFSGYTYVLLVKNSDPQVFEGKLPSIVEQFVEPQFRDFGVSVKYEVWPITRIHLHSDFAGEPETLGDVNYIYIFSSVALFLVLIASINYMNLATARSVKRSLEVGVRKVMGAHRSMIIRQFLTESILLTLFSFALALGFLFLLVPMANSTLELQLNLSDLLQPDVLPAVVIILLVTGVLGGAYPAFFLSSFQPAVVLKGRSGGRARNTLLRKVLVITQFVISIFMLIGTLVIYDQMNFVRKKDLGFDQDQVIRFVLNSEPLQSKWPVLRNKLLQNPAIANAGTASSSPGSGFPKFLLDIETSEGVIEQRGVDNYYVDYDYFNTLSIPIVKGRNYSHEFPSDSMKSVLVNEAMVRRMGWDDPIGREVRFGVGDSVPRTKVIGVVKDFYQQSLYNPIGAMLFFPNLKNSVVLVKITSDFDEAIAHVRESWAEVFPNVPFEFTFLEARFQEAYETDQLRGRLFLVFSLMTIVIACLGLLGLASYTAEQRTKEISIRKVLGADTPGLVTLLIKDFAWLVLISALPAFAIAWYSMGQWLQSFEYHVELNVLTFLVVLAAILFVTIVTTGYHALKAATSNPSETLKYE